jgi:hypothetical protein
VSRLKAEHFGDNGGRPIILHRRELVRREGPFAVLHDPDRAAAFNTDLLDKMNTLPFRIITVQIDKKEHLDRYDRWHFDPYHYCMRCLLERYVLWLNRHDIHGDVFVESRYRKADKKLKASFERVYQGGTDNVPPRMVQKRLTSHTPRLLTKQADCAGLQLCDLIAHPSARAMRFVRDGKPLPDDFGAKITDILNQRVYMRHPKSHKIEGWGTKWLP